MLRRSIAAMTGGGATTAMNSGGGAKKRNSLKLRKSVVNVKTSNQLRRSGGFLPADGRDSLKITITPERIENVIEYVKYFVPMDHLKESFSIDQIQQLFFHPLTTDASNLSPELQLQELNYQTMHHFIQLLQTAQMDYLDWFEFVLSRTNSNNEINCSIFCSEILRLAKDLRLPGFTLDHLVALYRSIIHNEDESYPMDRAQLDSAVKKYTIKEQQVRVLNATAAELNVVSIYMRKASISLFTLLQVTATDYNISEGMLPLSQLHFLISSLLLMYEVYVQEFGIPVIDDQPLIMTPSHNHNNNPNNTFNNSNNGGNPSEALLAAQQVTNAMVQNSSTSIHSGDSISIEPPSKQISDLTPWSNLQTQRSIMETPKANMEKATSIVSKRDSREGIGGGGTTDEEEEEGKGEHSKSKGKDEKEQSEEPSGLSRMLSMKSFKVPALEIPSVGSIVNSIRKSISFRVTGKSSPVVPFNDTKTTTTVSPSPDVNNTNNPAEAPPQKRKSNLPIEVNAEFIKHLDFDERIKVQTLVKFMREGESSGRTTGVDQSRSQEDNNNNTTGEQQSKSFLQRYSIIPSARSAKSNKSTTETFSTKKRDGNYLIISTDENDIDDILAQAVDNVEKEKKEPTNEEIVNNLVQSTAGRRRGSLLTSPNRVENLKTEMINSFNRRISIASVLIKHNR